MRPAVKVTDRCLNELLPRFVKGLNRLQPEYSFTDRFWRLPVRTGVRSNDWALLRATHYQQTYYLSWTAYELSLELDPQGRTRSGAIANLGSLEVRKRIWALKHFSRQVRRITHDDWDNPGLASRGLQRPDGRGTSSAARSRGFQRHNADPGGRMAVLAMKISHAKGAYGLR